MSKYFGYVRVSGLGQKSGDGPQRQRDAITTFCETHKLQLDPAIYEEAITGVTPGMERPQFSKMMARILEVRAAGGEADGIVLEKADRLSRDMVEGELIFRECRKKGIKVFATDRGLIDLVDDDSNPTAKLIRQIIGAVAEFDKSATVAKLRAAKDRIRKETGKCGGRKAYGELQGESQCLAAIAEMYNQKLNYSRIAHELNVVGFRNRKGTAWTRQSVESVIKNRLKPL